jgi:hypothetical protein
VERSARDKPRDAAARVFSVVGDDAQGVRTEVIEDIGRLRPTVRPSTTANGSGPAQDVSLVAMPSVV